MERVAKRLISPALIAWLFCPPVGLGAIVQLWVAIARISRGNVSSGERSLNLAKSWIRTSIYITLALLVVSAFFIYLLGPAVIPPMGSFY